MARTQNNSELLDYLAEKNLQQTTAQLPNLNEISKELGISVARLREQLEVAKVLGLVEAKPRVGLRQLSYSFLPAVRQSLTYAIQIDPQNFNIYSELRDHIEQAYWEKAVSLLTPADLEALKALVSKAWSMLHAERVKIPHQEHKQFHLLIYSRLNNPFVEGLLEAFWDAYEKIGANLYADYEYLEKVWKLHQEMVDAISVGNFSRGYQAMTAHRHLIQHQDTSELINNINRATT